jgi:hypothetical protein
MSLESTLELYRSLSALLQKYVLPAVEERAVRGAIKRPDLPLELFTFRVVSAPAHHNTASSVVQLNGEVALNVKVRAKKTIAAGDMLTSDDVHTEECWLEPIEVDGTPCESVLWQRLFLNSFLYLSRPHGAAAAEDAKGQGNRGLFPLEELLSTAKFCETTKPGEKLKTLMQHNWPPAPGYFPSIFLHLHTEPEAVSDERFVSLVSEAYSRAYWDKQLEFWRAIQLLSARDKYVEVALDRHFAGDYVSSIYVIVPQFEGLLKAYLEECGNHPASKFPDCVRQLKGVLLSRKVLLFPKQVSEHVFKYLESGHFWSRSDSIADPSDSVNRHGIVHGVFTGFECEPISLKYLILLDSLAFILLHDKVLRGKL